MNNAPSEERTLLQELDERQDHVLEELTKLNQRVETLLNECLDRSGPGGQPTVGEGCGSGIPPAIIPGDPNALISQSPESIAVPQGG